jgi:hypothetical protein
MSAIAENVMRNSIDARRATRRASRGIETSRAACSLKRWLDALNCRRWRRPATPRTDLPAERAGRQPTRYRSAADPAALSATVRQLDTCVLSRESSGQPASAGTEYPALGIVSRSG